MRRTLLSAAGALALACLLTPAVAAQEVPDDRRPAFTLSTSETFTTRETPFFHLSFRHVTGLDFRVYRVRDAVKFFAGLRDPHQLGSEEHPVSQEPTWIERLAGWKSRQRRTIRNFVRGQISTEFRAARRQERDQQQIARRVALNQTSFAQVPLLNSEQLVTSWRELLPDMRDPEYRRLPLDVKEPGVYLVEAVSGLLRAYTIVIVSDVGLVTKTSPGQMLVFAADRHTGEPYSGCAVQVLAGDRVIGTGTTAPDGVAVVALPAEASERLVGIGSCGSQIAATDPGAWYTAAPARQLVAYIYTDKPIYRPGHTVHMKAVLRWRDQDALTPFDARSAELSVRDLNDKVLFRQTVTPDTFGAVHAAFNVPDTAALGFYTVRVAAGEHEANGGFEVQEYRRPEYEVIVSPAERFVVQGGEVRATVQARYYFGQPVANARVRYVVNQQPYYSPLRWTDTGEGEEAAQFWYGDDQRMSGELRLDDQGRGEIRIPLDVDSNGRDYSARIEAQVTDASSREVSGSTVVHATYGQFLLTAQASGYMFQPRQPLTALIRALDYTGGAQEGVRAAVVLEHITYPNGHYQEPTRTAVGRTDVITGPDGTATAHLTVPDAGGAYRLVVNAPAGNREVRGETYLWVVGGGETTSTEGDRYLELIADKRSYRPGDVARLVLRGDTVSAPMLVTKEGQQVTWHTVLRTPAGEAIEVPIHDIDAGDIYVHVAMMRDGRLYRAERRLAVPPTDRALTITLTPDRPVAKPQEPGVFSVSVTDAAGAPVRAQVSLGVIDEAVYAIRPDDTPDPLRFFYRREYSRVGTSFSREYYFTGFSGSERLQLASRRRRPFTLADFKRDKDVQPDVRKEFPDAIYWVGDLVTDAQGRAKVAIKYPDALTTWRMTARAVTTDTRAGAAVVRTTTTKDLIVRVVTPRFLTEGDEAVVPTITHNYLPDARETTVTFGTRGLEVVSDVAPVASVIASGAERRDEWRVRAARPDAAVVTAAAKTGDEADAVELPLPVLPYGLRREVGVSGSLAGDGEHLTSVAIPPDANPAARRIAVSLAPSLAGSLLGALDFLTSFPYGCTEQTLSSFLPNVLVTRTLTQLKLVPTERLSLLDRQVTSGLRLLADYQHEDGGWGWWRTDDNHPFMTAYALFGLLEARRAGYAVEGFRIETGARALAHMYTEFPRAVPDLKAYLAWILRRAAPDAEQIDTYSHQAALEELWNARTRMSSYGRALLLLTLDEHRDPRGEELARALLAEATHRGELSWWAADRDPLLDEQVDASVEATALALQALARRDPSHPTIDRAVRWMMLNRRGGYWFNTKQTAFALYGLLEVLQARNETPRPFTVDVYVNGALTASHTFTAQSLTAPDPIVVSAEATEGENAIRLVTRGGGTLYWSARAVYYDVQGAQARTGGRELAISRRYARLTPVRQNDRIVYRESPLEGPLQPGDVLTVRLTVAGARDWRYLIVEDPLPAGVEAVQDTTAYPMEREDRWRWWWGSQTEYRDSRTVFFEEVLDEGRVEYVYLVKVIAAGSFRAAPAQVWPMYVPDVGASSDPVAIQVGAPGGSR